MLALGFVLMVINRFCGLVLPYSSKPFVDGVLSKRHGQLLLPIIGFVLTATIIQASTSFALTQLLSKAAQRMIADLRRQVQAHIGRLSVSFYDANRTGNLVSRIMTDVEGVRNLIGTGLVDFVGGIITALIAFAVLMKISAIITLIIFFVILLFATVLQKTLRVMRPIFRERGKINAEVTGRLTESLGGVRVVKGYHAEAREAGVFSGGVQRLLDNVMKSMTMTSALAMASTVVVGLMGSLVMFLGGREALANKITTGGYVEYTMFLAFMVAPIFQVVNVGTQLTEAIAGLDRTAEILGEQQEYDEPRARHGPAAGDGRCALQRSPFRVRTGQAGAARHLVPCRAGDGDSAGRIVGIGEVDDHQPDLRLPCTGFGNDPGGRRRSLDGEAGQLPQPAWCGAAGVLPVRRLHPGERDVLASGCDRGAVPERMRDCAGG